MPDAHPQIRVLRLVARMNLGGPAHQVSLLSARLDPERYRTLLVTGGVGPGEEEHTDLDGVTIRRLESLGPDIRPLQDLRALIALIGLIREFRPTIVHTHTAKAGLLGRVATLFTSGRRPLTIHTYHGHVLSGYFGGVKTGIFRTLERLLARVSDVLIGVSAATVDELVEIGVAPRSKFTVIPLGLKLDDFLELDPTPDPDVRRELGVRDGDVLFTYTGRLAPIKRPDTMLRALAIARGNGAPISVAVVGDGELRPEMEGLARELGCSDSVLFLGYRRDLPRIAGGSDAALLTSDNEGTPVALIEAAAAGRPAVATNVGGVSDIVVEGSGLLAPAGDAVALAAQMVRLAEDTTLRRRMGGRAREHVGARFGATRLLNDLDDLYTELIDARPNLDPATVEGFGQEWQSFDQSTLAPAELETRFQEYFRLFPWDQLPDRPVGFDMGCGSGRWARFVAPETGTLHCIDASVDALDVARRTLAGQENCTFHEASVDQLPLPPASMDFGYSLGVLHHVPDTQAGLRACTDLLRPGAPFLLYLYYALDNRPRWFRAVWRASDTGRLAISRLPHPAKLALTSIIALFVYLPLSRLAGLFARVGADADRIPLSTYRESSFYTLRTDALDRFGTRLEKRFTASEIRSMMGAAGLERVALSEQPPYWCAIGYKSA
jgi:glycosyltransferase involved in cell wall biosynthesis/SAM-dependent methyltransferase